MDWCGNLNAIIIHGKEEALITLSAVVLSVVEIATEFPSRFDVRDTMIVPGIESEAIFTVKTGSLVIVKSAMWNEYF